MTDIEERLQTSQRRIDAQNTKIARAALQKEQAQDALETVRAALRTEFSASTGAEIKKARAELEAEIESETAKIEAELEAAGA